MALPTNTTPIYTLVIPSTGATVKYRPFLVRDEKSLLIAQQSENPLIILDTIKEVIQACVKDKIDVDSLASFDIEYIFTQLRAVSVGEIVELRFACDTCTDEKAVANVLINLQELQVEKREEHSLKIPLFDDVGVMMKYPSFDTLKKQKEGVDNDLDLMFDITVDCIDYIYDQEEIHYAHEQSREALLQFLNNLTSSQFEKIQAFFRTMPRLVKRFKYTCPVCQKEHNKYLEGLSSFF
jgi:hypothetical protein